MIEFVLVLPVLLVILALLWFVGWSHSRGQRVLVAARHAVWADVDGQQPSAAEINAAMLRNAATDVDLDWRSGDTGELADWVDAVAYTDAQAAVLADRIFAQATPKARGVALRVAYDPPLPIGGDVGSTMTADHRRTGDPWAYGAADQRQSLIDLYYSDLDADLQAAGVAQDELAGWIRSLYLSRW